MTAMTVGCKKTLQNISFGDYSFLLNTKWVIYELTAKTSDINQKHNIDRSYIEKSEENTWYINSILIKKITIPNNDSITINKFKEENIIYTKKSLNNFTSKENYEKTFLCKDFKINLLWEFFSYKTNTEKTLYFGQVFFIHKLNGYIISISSDEDKDIDAFLSNIKDITCK